MKLYQVIEGRNFFLMNVEGLKNAMSRMNTLIQRAGGEVVSSQITKDQTGFVLLISESETLTPCTYKVVAE